MSQIGKRKKRAPTRRRKKGNSGKLFTARLFSFLILFGLLLFSMGAAGYVIFFRTTVAHGASSVYNWADIVFEEPYPVIPELPADLQPDGDSSLPMVAIIIDDMGYHEKIGSQLLALPINLTFSFLPSAPFTPQLEERAFQTGRVVLLHLPMEPKSKEWDPGQGALLAGQDRNQQKVLFYQNLQGVPHAVGLNNHMGSLYTENRAVMTDLMELVHEQGLFYVDSFTTAASQGLAAARAAHVPAARRHIFLDNVHSQDKVCKQLEKLVLSAEKEGWAIGIGHPNQATLSALTTCRGKLLERVRLVSAQELVMKLNSP